jgi:hypothetical protein
MSRKALGVLVCVDAILLLAWLSVPIHSLTPLQREAGIVFTVVLNLVFISRYSGIRFLAPAKPLSMLDPSIQESQHTSPVTPDDTVNPEYTVLRFLAAFLCIPAALGLVMAVVNAKSDGMQAAMPDVARSLAATYVLFWIFRRTKSRRNSS